MVLEDLRALPQNDFLIEPEPGTRPLSSSWVLPHPASRDRVVGFVAAGGTRKLVPLRADPTIAIVVRAGWQWTAVEDHAELIGPEDPQPEIDEQLRLLLREIFSAAGGTHDD